MPDGFNSETARQWNEAQFDKCRVLLFDPQTDTRYQTADALNSLGFRHLHDARDLTKLEGAYKSGPYDLLIGDTGGMQGTVCEMVRKLRHNAFGGNPFLGVILTTWSPTNPVIRRAVNSGTDHLLAKPFTREQINARVNAIIDKRKMFVVTLSYIGPDRRDDESREPGAERIKVPNSLRAKIRNDPTEMATQDAIESVMTRINRHKMSRYDLQIGVLIELLSRSFERREPTGRRSPRFKKISFLLNDLDNRVRKTGFAEASSICTGLGRLLRQLSEAENAPVELLDVVKQSAMALHLCFNPSRTATMIQADIDATVSKIENRKINPGG